MHCHSTRHITSTAPQPCAGSALWLRIKVCATAAAQGSQEGHEPADSLAINQPATSPEALLSGLWIKLRRGEELEGTGPAAVGAGAVLGAALSNAAAASMGKAALRGGFGVDGGKKRWKKKKKKLLGKWVGLYLAGTKPGLCPWRGMEMQHRKLTLPRG